MRAVERRVASHRIASLQHSSVEYLNRRRRSKAKQKVDAIWDELRILYSLTSPSCVRACVRCVMHCYGSSLLRRCNKVQQQGKAVEYRYGAIVCLATSDYAIVLCCADHAATRDGWWKQQAAKETQVQSTGKALSSHDDTTQQQQQKRRKKTNFPSFNSQFFFFFSFFSCSLNNKKRTINAASIQLNSFSSRVAIRYDAWLIQKPLESMLLLLIQLTLERRRRRKETAAAACTSFYINQSSALALYYYS